MISVIRGNQLTQIPRCSILNLTQKCLHKGKLIHYRAIILAILTVVLQSSPIYHGNYLLLIRIHIITYAAWD
jgi:hypothetical protein